MLASEDIYSVVEMVVGEMTNLSVENCEFQPPAPNLVGYEIEVGGAFNGSLTLETCSENALELSSRMLSIELAETTEDDIQEVMAELTNMIGGNIKSLLPGPSKLSIPKRRTEGATDSDQGSSERSRTVVRCGDRLLWITLNKS